MKYFKYLSVTLILGTLSACNTKHSDFKAFESRFPKVKLPYKVRDTRLICKKTAKNEIEYTYVDLIPEMKRSEYSREVSDYYKPVATLQKTENFTLLAYLKEDMEHEQYTAADTFGFTSIVLATFSRQGNPIDTLKFAYHYFPLGYMTGTISPDLIIERNETLNNWKKKAEDNHYRKKDLLKAQKIASYYKISHNGYFLKINGKPETYYMDDNKLGLLRQ